MSGFVGWFGDIYQKFEKGVTEEFRMNEGNCFLPVLHFIICDSAYKWQKKVREHD
jgi:hypothetical protein